MSLRRIVQLGLAVWVVMYLLPVAVHNNNAWIVLFLVCLVLALLGLDSQILLEFAKGLGNWIRASNRDILQGPHKRSERNNKEPDSQPASKRTGHQDTRRVLLRRPGRGEAKWIDIE